MSENYDVIILGGGVIGCATAYYLAKKGVTPLVIEAQEIGTGGSSRNGGGIRQSARDPRELPFAMHAVNDIWPGLSEELGSDEEYCQEGNLRLAKTEAHLDFLQNIVDTQSGMSLELEMVDGDTVKEILPYASDSIIGASWCPTDGHGNPMKTTLAFYKKALELGADFLVGEKAEEVIIRKGRVAGVRTSEALYESDLVINAAGVGAREIAHSVGLEIPMQPRLVEVIVTDQQPELFPQMLGTAGADFYGHQSKHGSFVFGGMTGWEAHEFKDFRTVTKSNTTPAVCRAVLDYFPWMIRTNVVRSWAGFLAVVADGVPVMGKVDELPGFIFASCFCGHGYGISPAVGEALAELVVDGRSTLPLDAFRYDRFLPRN
jgi:sarcosine oxidase subunit beta